MCPIINIIFPCCVRQQIGKLIIDFACLAVDGMQKNKALPSKFNIIPVLESMGWGEESV